MSLVGAIGLGIVHVSADSFSFKAQVGNAYTVGPRDQDKEREGLAGRLHRAARNYTENLALFVAAVVLVEASGARHPACAYGAYAWVAGRALYLPAYASGIPYARTVCWQIAMIGLVAMLVGVFL